MKRNRLTVHLPAEVAAWAAYQSALEDITRDNLILRALYAEHARCLAANPACPPLPERPPDTA